MKTILTAIFIALSLIGVSAGQTKDLTRWVNPFVGTGGHGHTFPGATMPFGMVQLSPDTRIDNWDGSSGYHYSDDVIYGFSHTHLNGTGIPDGCDILFMPTINERENYSSASSDSNLSTYRGYESSFSHADEVAAPGYYSVLINDAKLKVELTATKRVGMHRYTFPKSNNAGVFLDLIWRDKNLDSSAKLVGNRRIEGFRRSTSWAKDQTVYFVAEFSKPWTKSHGDTRVDDDKYSLFFNFRTEKDEQIVLKVAISHVSIEGARKNLAAELPGWDFDKVRADAKAAWNKELSKIEVSGGTDAQTTNFYTALYHTMIQPNIFNDVDGQYRGMDGKVHQLGSADTPVRMSAASARKKALAGGAGDADKSVRTPSEQYTVFSLWDTFRAAHPLYTIIDQKRTVDFINTFIRQYEQGGRLPVWELWANETECMIGYHSVSVIADAMAKGIKGFDYEKAYKAAKHSAELDHFGLAGYKKRGYISMEDENESVSRTLEYAYDDWCIAQMAGILATKLEADIIRTNIETGQKEKAIQNYLRDHNAFGERARYFENLFDSQTGFMRPKKNGGFVEPFAPNEVTFGFTEGNSWQYSFFAPHDVTRLMELLGGREKFAAKLDELFTTDQKLAGREQADLTGLIGQYAHGNEPSHHMAYLYDFAHQPWKTQKYVRKIMDEFYRPEPDGLIGNEDCGQMSAWYILSAGGFYPVTPGNGVYAIGTPLFPEMIYRLESGKTFTIRAKSVSSKNIYILNARLNGAPYKKAFITHEDIAKGGVLEFSMIDQPVETAFDHFPVTGSSAATAAVPVIDGRRVFDQSTTVSMRTTTKDATIFYTTDGSTPTRLSSVYRQPFVLSANTTVRAITVAAPGTESPVVDAAFKKSPNDWTVKVLSGYSTQYTGGGDNAIVDGIRGTVNFASGEWQGVQGKTYEAVIDLQRPTRVTKVGGSFLQVVGPWIWLPQRIEFEFSGDGVQFTKIAEIQNDVSIRDEKPQVREFVNDLAVPVTARYVRVRAYNIGKIPSWHLGAGGDPWIFVDEIIIR